MNAKTGNPLLIVGQTPPPWHGQAVATKMLFDHAWDSRQVNTLRMAYSDEMQMVGRFSFDKIGHLVDLIRKTRRILRGQPNTILFYPPASAHWVPFLRDVVYLCCVRHMAHGTVFIFHASGLADWIIKSKLRRCLARLAYHHADLALEVAVEQVPPHRVFDSDAWEWCPCAAEVPLMKRDCPAAGKPLRVLFVGSLQEGKGVLEIVKTVALLKARGHEGRFKFQIVGRCLAESFKKTIDCLVAQLDVRGMVELTGELTGDAKWLAYQNADIFFFPSHYQSEASPIVLMEALGAGLPLITTKWRGIPALVEGCDSARLLPIQDPEAYADALLEIAARPENIQESAISSRAFYERHYQVEHFTGRVARALERKWPICTTPAVVSLTEDRTHVPKSNFRVLQVFNQYAEAGGEEVWVDQVTSLSNARLQFHELRFHSRAWKMRGAPSPLVQAFRMWDNPESRRRLRYEVANLQPDVLLFHNLIPVASFGLYDEARKIGLPVLQYIHNFRPFSPSGTMWHGGRVHDEVLKGNPWSEILGGAWERSIAKTGLLAMHLRRLRASGWLDVVDRWIAISEFMRDKFVEAGIPASKITTLRHCWLPLEEEPSVSDQEYYLFLGRLVPEKGIGTLLEAWSKLERKLGKDCPRLVIAGTGPEESKVLECAARSRTIEAIGFVSGEAKHRMLSHCRAVLAPSIWWEPLGLIVYEAYDYNKPVIAARSGGLVETVHEGQGGFLFTPGNVASLVDAVVKLEELGCRGRAEMGRTGRRWLLNNASPVAWKKSFESIVKSVTHG